MGGDACVCWFSRTQKCVTLSLSEAEYVALGDAMNELFLRQVLHFMIPGKGMPCFPVFEDNRGALQLSKNPVSNSKFETNRCSSSFFERACPPGGHQRKSCSF